MKEKVITKSSSYWVSLISYLIFNLLSVKSELPSVNVSFIIVIKFIHKIKRKM